MSIRQRTLPTGWYPANAAAVKEEIAEFMREKAVTDRKALAGIVPHAGWGYSGDIACHVISCLKAEHQTVVVVGGHLGAGGAVLAAGEEAFETPLGKLEADSELLAALKEQMPVQDDLYQDNTVEIQLPFIRYFFPSSRVLWLRAPASQTAVRLGRALRKTAEDIPRELVVLGSTDLTHYGSNYGFTPRGTGPKAVAWVKQFNDRAFIDAALQLNLERLLTTGNREKAACSAGGAACAASFARESGIGEGALLDYKTSYDVYPAESFVGYAGIAYFG